MPQTRIYVIRDRIDDTVRLVEASTAAQALRHVAAQAYDVAVAKPKTVAHHMARDVVLEVAGVDLETEAA